MIATIATFTIFMKWAFSLPNLIPICLRFQISCYQHLIEIHVGGTVCANYWSEAYHNISRSRSRYPWNIFYWSVQWTWPRSFIIWLSNKQRLNFYLDISLFILKKWLSLNHEEFGKVLCSEISINIHGWWALLC